MKVKILKKLPKQKVKPNTKRIATKKIVKQENKFKSQYFQFYDDIKDPTHKIYDW